MSDTERKLFEQETDGDATIIHVLSSLIMDELEIESISVALTKLATDSSLKYLILDLERVDYFSSMFLAKLLLLMKRLKERGGCLVLCHVKQEVQQIWRNSPSFEPFKIVESVQEARRWCAGSPGTS